MPWAMLALGAMMSSSNWIDRIADFRARVDGSPDLKITVSRSGRRLLYTLVNDTPRLVRAGEAVLFEGGHGWSPSTPFYGEGLTMLSQYGGTLEHPADYGQYQDRSHYRLPEPAGFRRVYGVALISPSSAPRVLIGFGSSRRFVGAIDLSADRIRVTQTLDDITIPPHSKVQLESLVVEEGPSRAELFNHLASEIAKTHPKVTYPAPPKGWCSWYCFGPGVTARNVRENADVMKRGFPALKFVQIDDGYQPAMGDWLETGKGFGGVTIQAMCHEIVAKGLRPAIWVAPFIAERDSKLFKDHPDWFVTNDSGEPLDSSTVMFGGWRRGPWYVLDGTHPGAQRYLERVFATMRREWGVTYFKLDANFWGMVRGGKFHDPNATRVEAYRRGMEAVRRGAGRDAYLLGCNHPIWPSIGLIDGSRSSMDIERTWESIASTGRENLRRAWQNGKLWWNDPDCLVLSAPMTESLRRFHTTILAATGGAIFSGDDLTQATQADIALVNDAKLFSSAAEFADDGLEIGRVSSTRYVLFNWTDHEVVRSIPHDHGAYTDRWTGETILADHVVVPPRSARILDLVRRT